MKSNAYRMAMLFDFFGGLLTEKQQEYFDLYYNEDFSLAEIAENNGITRQGVRDIIVRAESILNETEDKTGLVKRFMSMRSEIADIEAAADEISEINDRQYGNERIKELSEQVLSITSLLKE